MHVALLDVVVCWVVGLQTLSRFVNERRDVYIMFQILKIELEL